MADTVYELVREQCRVAGEAIAFLAPGRRPLTYAGLLREIDQKRGILRSAGVSRGDRVATVLANGPDAAAAFLTVASCSVCAPLNPAYREAEFAFYLSDLQPKLLILDAGPESPAAAAARSQGVPVMQLVPCAGGAAGVFGLEGDFTRAEALPETVEPDDAALVLHTSGTTSRPKQVPLTHANLCCSAHNIARSLALARADRCLSIMPLFHIHGLAAAVLASLGVGASVACSPGFLAPRFFEWLREFQPTWYTAVPAMHQAILARAEENPETAAQSGLRLIRSCSSALAPKLMLDLERAFGVPVIEAYGMTEAAHQMASNPLPPAARKPGSVGRAAGPEVAIMDEHGTLLEAGASGEVVIRGPNVTRGYVANPQANAASFTNGWFRTGDVGSLDPEGYLFLSGRTKEIINRGGEKIAPREVDEALLEHPAVAQALAFAAPDERLGEDVAAAVVLRKGAAVSALELQEFAASRLAAFKVPGRIVFLDEIPKGPTGKPQRIGLAAKLGITAAQRPAETDFIAPRNAVEEKICSLWRHVLGKDRIGIRDAFLDSGGDSVLAAQLLARLAEETGAEMPVTAFFAAPTVEAMAGWLASRQAAAMRAPRIAPGTRSEETRLSFAQERMWFLTQLEQDHAPYIRPAVYRLTGPLDFERLRTALQRIVERHESLRTIYRNRDGVPVQIVERARPLEIELLGTRTLEEVEQQLIAEQAHRPFDLAREPMIRVSLAQLGAGEHCLLVTMHHIASDGWSSRVCLRELAALYAGTALPPLAVQYRDYAEWQRTKLSGEALDREIAHWKERLAGIPALLELPVDRQRPARQTFHGAREVLEVPKETVRALESLSRSERATLFMTLAAAFYTLLHRYSNSADIVIGCPAANRTQAEIEPLIGLFVNTLPLRADLSGNPEFSRLLARVRESAIDAYAHQDVPFEKLVEALEPARSLSYSPVFQVMFQLRNLPAEISDLGGVRLEALDFDPQTAPFDLTMDIRERAGGLYCALDYNTGLFDRSTAGRMLRHYGLILETVVRNPAVKLSEIPLGTEKPEWNATAREWPPELAADLFEEQASRVPEALAVVDGADRLTFRELNERANQVAWRLRENGVGPEQIVGVQIERSASAIVALLGVLKAGAAFLPLDPAYPRERLAFVVDDTKPAAVLKAEDIAGRRAENPLRANAPDDAAYVIYTSGSMGTPKGVVGLHRGLINRLRWMWEVYPFGPGEVCCHKTALSFVDSIAEILGPLAAGVPLVILRNDTVKESPTALLRSLDAYGATRIVLVPSLLAALVEALEAGTTPPRALRHWVSSGERLTADLARRFHRVVPWATLLNLYGSSEVSADVTFHAVDADPGDTVPIGRPIANTAIQVLDGSLAPVPLGATGEIYVGGAGLARGYLNRPELTEQRFIQNPGMRLFRTGDLGRRREDGALEYLGRADAQIKVRGFRIEPAEVEAALAKYRGVSAAAVNADEQGRLRAYVVCGDEAGDSEKLRRYLLEKLPEYMVPRQFLFIPSLPLNSSGKVDRRALAALRSGNAESRYAPPADASEAWVAATWEELLDRSRIGRLDDFFDLGGHSLLAARLMARVEKAFGTALPVAAVFEAPTVEQFAIRIRATSKYAPRIRPLHEAGTRIPLLCVGGAAYLRPFARALPDQPVFGVVLEADDEPAIESDCTVESIAALYVRYLTGFQPRGPYLIAGHSFHGLTAYEAARQLTAAGQEVALVVLFDTFLPSIRRKNTKPGARLRARVPELARLAVQSRFGEAVSIVREIGRQMGLRIRTRGKTEEPAWAVTAPAFLRALRQAAAIYEPQPYDGRVLFIEAAEQATVPELATHVGWSELVRGGFERHVVPGDHATIFAPENAPLLAGVIDRWLAGAQPPASGSRDAATA